MSDKNIPPFRLFPLSKGEVIPKEGMGKKGEEGGEGEEGGRKERGEEKSEEE